MWKGGVSPQWFLLLCERCRRIKARGHWFLLLLLLCLLINRTLYQRCHRGTMGFNIPTQVRHKRKGEGPKVVFARNSGYIFCSEFPLQIGPQGRKAGRPCMDTSESYELSFPMSTGGVEIASTGGQVSTGSQEVPEFQY